MLAGPDLLVILGIALIVFGPKKLPELAKTIGGALGQFKKTTEEMKESIGIKDLQEIKGNFNGIDLFTELAEKVSASMTNKEAIEDVSVQGKHLVQRGASPPAEASILVGNRKEPEKEKDAKSEGAYNVKEFDPKGMSLNL